MKDQGLKAIVGQSFQGELQVIVGRDISYRRSEDMSRAEAHHLAHIDHRGCFRLRS